MLKHALAERICIAQGPKDAGKTHVWARFALIDYWCYPNDTLWLISSTDLRGLELRIWGDLKDLFTRAKERYDWLAGNPLDSKHGIFTDKLSEDSPTRDIRKGMICIPCVGGNGEWVGMEKYVGIKQKRRRLLGDELQFMKQPYLSSLEHLDKGDFKLLGSGNPIGKADPLDKIAEPERGWGSEGDSEKTQVWRNKWGGITINFDGRDTPNNDEPKNRFPYLILAEDIERTSKRRGINSMEYWVQCVGKRRPGLLEFRVLTREMCLTFGAFKPVAWQGSKRTKVYGIDASYGGDRCVAGWAEFGMDVDGSIVISFHPYKIIEIMVYDNTVPPDQRLIPEDQIAMFVKADCERENIPPSHVFFDSTGRGSLGTSFGRLWNPAVNPVEFGGTPTDRPVTSDFLIKDPKTSKARLKLCSEHYRKRVTEYWYSVRYCVESGQIRDMPEDVAEEFGMREWYMVAGDKRELEEKEETKLRMGCSPDLADWACIIVEGARRLGFNIKRLAAPDATEADTRWKESLRERFEKYKPQHRLNYKC